MVRGVTVAVCGAAIVVAGLSGCSSKKEEKASESSKPSATASASMTSGSVTASAGSGTAKVTIDGAPQDVDGQVVCSTVGDNFNIAIGNPTTGIGVMMAEDGSKVNSVGLGNVNGVALGFQEGAPGGEASATKDGKTYTIKGTATGVDMANPMQPMTKPFEISVTCP
ncbi:MAG: lipoprotein LpqH [Mycobacterium sp.]|nr:lipoprotein LpqH [Mycobacterium sp.]